MTTPNAGLFLGKGTWEETESGDLVAVFKAAQSGFDPASETRKVSYTKETLENMLDYLESEARRTFDSVFKNVDYQYAKQTLKEFPGLNKVVAFNKPEKTLMAQTA